jgi:hypothetical protein
MPALAFVGLVALVLVSLVASDLYGLPKVSRHRHLPYTTQSLTTTPASVSDMTSQAVLAAQPSETLAKVDSAARAARAEAQRTTAARAAISRPLGGREFGLSLSY